MALPTHTPSWRRSASLGFACGYLLLAGLAHAAVDFRQSANNDSPHALGDVHWIGSILQQQNSRYVEGMSTLQRLLITGIEPKKAPDPNPNTHTLTFRHQSSKTSAGSHAYDYLTSWDQAVAAANAYAVGQGLLSTLNVCGPELGPPASFEATCIALHASANTATPDAPDAMGTVLGHNIAASVAAYEVEFGNRTIKVYARSTASALTGVSLAFNGYTAGSDPDAQYTLTWTSDSDEILIEFAGHLASGLDPVNASIGYGAGTGSSSINGGPYHIPLDLLDGASIGNQDNQIKGADIILPCPEVDAGPDGELTCTVTQINLSGSSSTPGATFSWVASNGGNIVSGADTATPLVDAAGTYTLTVSVAGNPCTADAVALVTLDNTPPNVDAGADGELTCTVTQINLNGSSSTPGATFSWVASNGGNIVSGADTATPLVDAAGTYTLTVTDPANGCIATQVALVTLDNTPPNVDAGADGELTCTVTQINLNGSSSTPGATFSWVASSGGNIVSGADSATPLVDAAGTYTLTVTDPANGCTATQVALVTLDNTPPNVDAGADGELTCTVTQINLNGSSSTPGATFSWVASNGGNIVSGADSATPLVDAAGTYTLTVTDPANGCIATQVALVTLDNTPPNVDAGADGELTCTVTQINLNGSSSTPGATFSWVASNGGNIVSGANTASPLVDAAGTYTLTVTDPANGCTATQVALVTLDNTPPNVDAGADGELTCTVTQINLNGSSSTPGATFSWVASNGGNIVSGADTATPLVDAAGTYTLTVTDPANGCTASQVALVTLDNTPPNVDAGADGELTCTVTQINLNGSSSTPGATFSWVASNGGNIVSGANTASPLVDAAGTYTLTVTDPANGCTATQVALVTLDNTPPNVDAGADGELTCTVTQINLNGSSSTPGATFSWVASNGGNIVSGADSATPLVDAAGTYTLTVTDPANGCTATQVALVTLDNTPPNVSAGADGALTCTVSQVTLTGSSSTPGATFNWVASNGGHIVSGANTPTPLVDAAGTYTLTVTDPANGCTAAEVALVTPAPLVCGGEGCTPGFWCGGAGSQYWDVGGDGQWTAACTGANPFTSNATFCGAPLNLFNCHPDVQGMKMSDLLCKGGGKIWAQKAARDVIAAYLNASCDGVAFGMEPAAVAQLWNDAVAGVTTFQAIHNTLSALNDPPGEDNCPLGRVRTALGPDPVNSETPPEQEPQSTGPKLELYRPTPNPFASAARLAYEVASSEGERVEIGVYDIAGRRIRMLVNEIVPAGRHETRWDGLSDAGGRVTNGLYFIRISVGAHRRTVPVVSVR